MRFMMRGLPVDGYEIVKANKKEVYRDAFFSMKLVEAYRSPLLHGYVLEVENLADFSVLMRVQEIDFAGAVGSGVILFLFWLLFWSTPEPGPMNTTKRPKGKDQREGLYDLKIGSWQNRVDQDLEATKKQLADMDVRQQEIRDHFKNIGDALSDLTLQMKAEKESRLAANRAAPPMPEQKAMGSGINVMRFAAKSSAAERSVKAKTEVPAIRQTSYLPGGSMAHSVLLTGVDAPVGG